MVFVTTFALFLSRHLFIVMYVTFSDYFYFVGYILYFGDSFRNRTLIKIQPWTGWPSENFKEKKERTLNKELQIEN